MKLLNRQALAVLVVAAALPAGAQATSLYHPSMGELSAEYFPDHSASTRSRAEVTAEMQQLKREGILQRMHFGQGYPLPNPGKTRAEVQAEMQQMTAAERARARSMGGYPQ